VDRTRPPGVPPREDSTPADDQQRARVRARAILGKVSGRWDVVVLRHLAIHPRRPGELLRVINIDLEPGGQLSRPVLFRVLARLGRDGLVESRQVPGGERATLYTVTGLGVSILDRVSQLARTSQLGAAEPGDWWIPVDEGNTALDLPGIDTSKPNVARMYDYWLGGKDSFAADRAAADQVEALFASTREMCQHNREFLRRAVTHLATSGIRQFLDIGTGLPTMENTHDMVQRITPEARVAYVDNDSAVVTHAQALLATSQPVTAVRGDLRDPAAIIANPEVSRLIDFSEPVAVVLAAVLHFVSEHEQPDALLQVLKGVMAPGSALLISHATDENVQASTRERTVQIYKGASAPLVPRGRERIEEFFRGLELIPPGLVNVRSWRPLPGLAGEHGDLRSFLYGGVGIKGA